MLHIILGILTIILTILKWLGFLLLILLLLALALVLIALLVPVRYRGRGEKTEQKQRAELAATWFLHLIMLEASVDTEGTMLEVHILGKTPEAWRSLLKKRKENKRKKNKRKKKRQKLEKAAKPRTQQEPPAKAVKHTQQESTAKSLKHTQPEPSAKAVKHTQQEPPAEAVKRTQPEQAAKTGQSQQKPEESKASRLFWRLKGIVDGGVKAVQGIRYTVPKTVEKIRRILHRPSVFLEFWERYEVGEVLSEVKDELFTLLVHYRPRHLTGYLKFGTEDPAQTGELTGVLYLLLPTQEYEIIPDFEETQFVTETEFSGQIRSIHLLVTAYHLFRNKKLKRLIRKLRKKGE